MQISVQQYLQHNIEGFSNWNRFAQTVSIKVLRRLFHEDEINNFLQENVHKDCYGFIESALDRLNIDITLHKNQLENIPSYGRAVLIANHPLGAIDAFALLSILKEIRRDIKIVATSMLTHEPTAQLFHTHLL